MNTESPSNIFGCSLSKQDGKLTLFSVLQQQDEMQKVKKCHGRYDPLSPICPALTGDCWHTTLAVHGVITANNKYYFKKNSFVTEKYQNYSDKKHCTPCMY